MLAAERAKNLNSPARPSSGRLRPREIADPFQANHPAQSASLAAAQRRMLLAAHFVEHEVRHLLGVEENEPNGSARTEVHECASDFDQRRHRRGIVVRSRRADGRVVLGAHDQLAQFGPSTRHRHFKIHRDPRRNRIRLLKHRISGLLQLTADICLCRLNRAGSPRIPLTDQCGQHVHVAKEFLGKSHQPHFLSQAGTRSQR